MKKPYVVTDKLYNEYKKHLKGNSHRYACGRIGVAPSTMRDYLKRNKLVQSKDAEDKTIEYAVMRHRNMIGFIIGCSIYKYNLNDQFYIDNSNVFSELVSRLEYIMKSSEFEKYFGKIINDDIKKAKEITKDRIKIEDNSIYYKGVKVSKALCSLINLANKTKQSDQRIIKFADLLIQNEDPRVVEQLYDFIKHNDIEICPNGYVLTYKAVSSTYLDLHSGKFDNSIGKRVKMDRKNVDSDPKKTCSHGLHVASLSYINSMYTNHSYKIIKCIVHPKDFVSIPEDYNGAKARVCSYKVSADYKK